MTSRKYWYQPVQKKAIFTFCILVTLVVFRHSIELLLSKSIVKYLMADVKPDLVIDTLLLLTSFFVLAYIAVQWKKYIISGWVLVETIAIILCYSYYRWFDAIWIFVPFKLFSHLYYADLIFVFAGAIITLWLSGQFLKHAVKINSGFYSDQSIGDTLPDEFGYEKYVSQLTAKINDSYFNQAFAIGINGKWGSGKSSFLDLMRRRFKTADNIIFVNFDPWRCQTPQSVINEFFNTVQEALQPYHSRLSSLLMRYAEQLLKQNSNEQIKTTAAFIASISGYDSADTLYKEINDAIRATGKRLVVFVDDVDRLDKEEIVEVIRLIRNTANFSHTFFVVAYDRSYVLKALSQHNAYNHEQFLEKIFQIEITLPHFNKKVLQLKLAEQLYTVTDLKYHADIQKDVIGTPSVKPTYLTEWLESLRDVTRLTNSLVLNMSGLWGEVVFAELLQLELLRIKYPAVYNLLHQKKEDFLEHVNQTGDRYEFQLKRTELGKRGHINGKIETVFLKYLEEHKERLGVPAFDLEKVYELVSDIFGENILTAVFRSPLSVRSPVKFELYFQYRIDSAESLSEIEFTKAMQTPQEELRLQIDKWVADGLEGELQLRWMRMHSFNDREEFEKSIRAIFYLASLPSYYNTGRNIIGYDERNLYNKLHNGEHAITKKFYNNLPADTYCDFLKSIFEDDQLPIIFKSKFVYHLTTKVLDLDTAFPLTKGDLVKYNIGYFKTYGETATSVDLVLWNFYRNCEYLELTNQGNGNVSNERCSPPEAKEIFISLVTEKLLDSFIVDVIQYDQYNQNLYAFTSIIIEFFGNLNLFKSFILQQQLLNKWEYLEELLEFINAIESSEFPYIPFDFKKIPVRKGNP